MPGADALVETLVSRSNDDQAYNSSSIALIAGTICLIWYTTVSVVCILGFTQLWRHFSHPPAPSKSSNDPNAPKVTIIRPIKGLEPSLYQCLAATFRQDYPKEKLRIFLCMSDDSDPALPVAKQLLKDFPDFDVHLLIEEEDPRLQDNAGNNRLGPNPKIRNMSRAYREAEGDIVWIIDCNVWVAKGACGRMVDTLVGNRGLKNKLVHLLPLVVDVVGTPVPEDSQRLLGSNVSTNSNARVVTSSTESHDIRTDKGFSVWKDGGGRIEELFMSSAHPKFYTAINTVLIAPCIVGKSTMFRRSHLDNITEGKGIDFFSENICEDHLIGDLLWKNDVPPEQRGERWGNHAMVFGDLAIQPMAGMSVPEYVARRIRWLRVRKFTVTLATFVEPGTESFLCSLYGAFAFTTLPFFHDQLGIPRNWPAFTALWLLSVSVWCGMDWLLYQKLHSGASIEVDSNTPSFARPQGRSPAQGKRRHFLTWFYAWLARETLALPIWTWAVYGGVTVAWRGKRFWVGMDMKVHEIMSETKTTKAKAQ